MLSTGLYAYNSWCFDGTWQIWTTPQFQNVSIPMHADVSYLFMHSGMKMVIYMNLIFMP